jgi:hypothetical protein
MPIKALAETSVFVLCFGFLLATDCEHAISELHLDIFLVKARQFRSHLHLFVGLADLDVGPAEATIEKSISSAERRKRRVNTIDCPRWPLIS